MSEESKNLIEKVEAVTTELRKQYAEAHAEIAAQGQVTTETKARIDTLEKQLTDMEVKLQRGTLPGGTSQGRKSIGAQFIESKQYKDMVARGSFESDAFETKDLISSDNAGDVVLPMRVPGIVTPGERAFRLRDLLAAGTTASNLVEFVQETGFDNQAAPVAEGKEGSDLGGLKPESGLAFEKASEAVITLAHWVPATRQIISDAGALQSYINNRLIYGLKITEEDQLLNGAGGGTEINGLITQATAFDTGLSEVDDTKVDTIRRAILQARLAEYPIDGVVLHPTDWADIELLKGEDKRYLWVTVPEGGAFQLWRVPVVETTAIAEGTFLAGAFKLGAQIWDREGATIRVSEHHSDFFIRNIVAILCEERLALTVYRPEAFITGSFVSGS